MFPYISWLCKYLGSTSLSIFCLIADHKGSSTERWSKSDFQGLTCPPDACLFIGHVRYIRNDSACKTRERCFGLGSKPVYNSEYSNLSLVKLGPLSQDLVLVIHWLGKVKNTSRVLLCMCVCAFFLFSISSHLPSTCYLFNPILRYYIVIFWAFSFRMYHSMVHEKLRLVICSSKHVLEEIFPFSGFL